MKQCLDSKESTTNSRPNFRPERGFIFLEQLHDERLSFVDNVKVSSVVVVIILGLFELIRYVLI
jgi:hypothetical protein